MAIFESIGDGWARRYPPLNKNEAQWAFIVCPGPSLGKVDLGMLKGKGRTVFGINTTYPALRPDIWMGLDHLDCYDEYLTDESFIKFWGPANKNSQPVLAGFNNFFIDTYIPSSISDIFEPKNSVAWWHCTFRATIHLVLSLGFKRIAFIGSDLSHAEGDYFHEFRLKDYQRAKNTDAHSNILNWMKEAYPLMQERGIEVVSCSEKSALNSLMPYVNVGDLVFDLDHKEPSRAIVHSSEASNTNKSRILIQGMHGLGDNYYQYPVIREIAKRYDVVELETPWPQLYAGIDNIDFVNFDSHLRSQSLNLKNSGVTQSKSLAKEDVLLSYWELQKHRVPIYAATCIAGKVPQLSYKINHPSTPEPKDLEVATAIIRPATIRKEWPAQARNPKQEYINTAARVLKDLGFQTWLVAHLEEGLEDLDGDIDRSLFDVDKSHGELSFEELTEAVMRSSVCVSPVGFIAPMCMAYSIPSVIIHGGAGGLNHPDIINAPADVMPTHVTPTNYHNCQNNACRDCDKTIKDGAIEKAIKQALGLDME